VLTLAVLTLAVLTLAVLTLAMPKDVINCYFHQVGEINPSLSICPSMISEAIFSKYLLLAKQVCLLFKE
jgi:hypothetical protein